MNLVLYSFAYLFFIVCIPRASAQQTFFPSSVPLFFRSPYVYAYIRTGNGLLHSNVWPRLSTDVPSLGWTGLIKVDNGTTYLWSGDTGTVAGTNNTVLKYFTVTPTRTIFTIQAGPMELNITHLSPIEPDDFVKQSIPFSYLSFEARSTDGSPHHVQVYTGITNEWLSTDHTQNHTWATTPTKNGSQIHSFSYSTPQEFNERDGLASWGTPYYATRQGNGVTYRIGLTQPGPTLFVAQGFLDNSIDPGAPREISPQNQWTSLTFAHDLGAIESTSAPIVWAFGHTFDSDNTSAMQYQDLSGIPQRRSLYYVTQYSDDHTLIDDFLNDFPAALERAIQFDANLTNAAASTIPGTEYSNLIALAARQVMGFTSLTVSKGSDGLWNKSDVMMFWRDVDNGTPEQANPPDGLYASFPMFLYLNPSLGAPLLEPLLRFQNSPAYTDSTPYAAANIGRSWPNMTANNSYHNQGSEQSANMIILSYAQARATGDTSLVGRYYQLLKSWADYLLTPATTIFNNGQMSADGLAIVNQTNLAIKGIIAIKAMSMIANLTGNTADATTYSEKSLDLYTQWKSHALADDGHMLLAYGADSSTFSHGYNIFADLWLGTGVVDSNVTSGLSHKVNDLLSLGSPYTQYGLPIDSTTTDQVQSAWNMFIAAAVNDTKTRDLVISRVYGRVAINTTVPTWLYPLTWSSTNLTASSESGDTSPRQGAIFAPLVLSNVRPPAPTSSTGSGTSPAGSGTPDASSHPHTAAIAGGVVGGVLGGVALVGLTLWLWRHHKRTQRHLAYPSGERSAQNILDTEPFTMQDAHSQSTSTGSPTVLSPKGLLALRHTTRLTHATSMIQVPEDLPPVTAPSNGQVILDPRVDELRRDLDALRLRAEPPPSYVNE